MFLPVLAVARCPLSDSEGVSSCLTGESKHAPSEAGAYVVGKDATEASFLPAWWGPLALHWRLRLACVALPYGIALLLEACSGSCVVSVECHVVVGCSNN